VKELFHDSRENTGRIWKGEHNIRWSKPEAFLEAFSMILRGAKDLGKRED